MEETVQVSLFLNKSQATQCLGKQSSMFFIPSFPLLLGSQKGTGVDRNPWVGFPL